MSEGLQCGILIVVLNLLAGNLGDLSPPVRNYAGLALWLPVLLGNCRDWAKPFATGPAGRAARAAPKLRAWLSRGLAVVAFLLAPIGFAAGRVHAVAALLLSLWLVRLLANGTTATGPRSEVLLLTAAGTGLWLLGQELSPQLFILNDRLSFLSCRISSALTRSNFVFGPSYSGVLVSIILVWFHLGLLAVFRPRRWPLFLAFLAGQLLLLLAYQALFHTLLKHCQLESPWVVLGTAQWGLLVGAAALGMSHFRCCSVTPSPPLEERAGERRPFFHLGFTGKDHRQPPVCADVKPFKVPCKSALAWAGIATVLVFLCVADAFCPLLASRPRTKVLLYDDGTLDWRTPVYGQYGGVRGGMFGSLVPFLQRHECDAWRGGLTNLDQANVLVVFNLMHKLRPEEKRQIWEFIARGGSLLAVGDHTGTTQIREPFNDLLEPVNIQFNFDSAMPIRRGWVNGLQWFPQPATALLASPADAQIMVGASLSLRPPAKPLVIGTHGWSDNGDLQNRTNGFLGDRRFSVDERLGDVVLVARADYRGGKVIVFGDTTSFQNTVAARGGDFIQTVLRSLTLKESRWLRLGLRVLLLGALGAMIWGLARSRNSFPSVVPPHQAGTPLSRPFSPQPADGSPSPPLEERAGERRPFFPLGFTVRGLPAPLVAPSRCACAVLTLFVCIYVGAAAGTLAGRHAARGLVCPPPIGEAVVDTSHLSRCDPDLWWPDGLGGVSMNLMRKGYMPTVTSQFAPELLRTSRVCFLVAPAKPFTRRELEIYEDFVRNGGELFVCAGYEDSSGCAELLRQFGLRLRNLPLGAIGPDANDARIYLLNAWPITAEPRDGSEVLCRQGDYPVIVARHCGRGRLVLVGDSGFFRNRNLELAEGFNPENIQFFRQLVPAHE